MPEIDVKLSQISPSGSDATSGTQIVAVQGGATDNLFSLQQVNNGPFFSTISNGIGGALARSPASRFSDVVNVKDFGALGNNSHDDTANINAAIVAAANSGSGLKGGVVFFPPGTYLTTGPLFNGTSATHVALLGANSTASRIIGTVTPTPTVAGFTIDQNDGTGLASNDAMGPNHAGTIDLIENLTIQNTYVSTRLWPANVITAASWSNGTGAGLSTFTTTTAHTVSPGEYFVISGCSASGAASGGSFNGNFIAQAGTTGSTLIGSHTWVPSLVGPNVNAGTLTVAGTLVAQTVGYDPTVGAIRFNNALGGAIRHCQPAGFNGIVSISNSYNAHFDAIYMPGFGNRPGSVGFNIGQCTLTGCTVLGYWVGVLCSTTVGGYLFGFRCESTQTAILIGAAATDGTANSPVANFNVVGMQTEHCERSLVFQNLTAGFFGNLVLTGTLGLPHTADFTGTGATATCTVRTTGAAGPGTLDQLGWTSGVRQIRVISGGAYTTPGSTWVTATRTSNTTFTYASTGTGPGTGDWSLQVDTVVTFGSILAKFITIAGCSISGTTVALGNISGSHYKLSALASANTLISCQGPAGATLWQMPPSTSKASYQYINCNQPGGTTLDAAGVASGMNFADLPGQAGVNQPGPVTGMQYDIKNCNSITWGDTATGGGATQASVRWNGTKWSVVGI